MFRFVLRGAVVFAAIFVPLALCVSRTHPPSPDEVARHPVAGGEMDIVHPAPVEIRLNDLEMKLERLKAEMDEIKRSDDQQ